MKYIKIIVVLLLAFAVFATSFLDAGAADLLRLTPGAE